MLILCVLYNRPDYTKEVLDALVSQLNNSHFVLFQIDGNNKQVIDLAYNFPFANKLVVVNNKRVGCNQNIWKGLKNAFDISDEVCIVEDDVLPGKDFIKYIEWGYTKLNDNIRAISTYRHYVYETLIKKSFNLDCSINNQNIDTSLYNTSFISDMWTCWGWALNIHTWKEIIQVYSPNHSTIISWDVALNSVYFSKFKVIKPYLSRTNNIGSYNGTYTPSPEWHKQNCLLKKWVNTEIFSAGNYILND